MWWTAQHFIFKLKIILNVNNFPLESKCLFYKISNYSFNRSWQMDVDNNHSSVSDNLVCVYFRTKHMFGNLTLNHMRDCGQLQKGSFSAPGYELRR